MIKKNKVSLWLGKFSTSDEFSEYVEIDFSEDGDYIKSKFQEDFGIMEYTSDLMEKDWLSGHCDDLESLLSGFSYDYQIIPEFQKIICKEKLINYNSILLLYDFEYEKGISNNLMDYIGCVDVNKDITREKLQHGG